MPKIMIVDDDVITVTELIEALRSSRYEIGATAESGDEAVKMAKKTHPDLVLMDIVMPGKIDGIEAATRIRTDLNIPVIFLTGYSEEEFIDRAKSARSYGYLLKPFSDAQVSSAIEIALYNFGLEKSLKEAHDKLEKVVEERTADLEKTFNQMSALINASSDAAQLLDKNGNIITANKISAKRLKAPLKELLGKCVYDYLPPEVTKKRKGKVEQVIKTGKPSRFEDKMGRLVLQNTMYPVMNTKGKVTQLAVYSRDVTQEKRNVAALKKREKELKARTRSLEEANTAFSILLRRREEDRTNFESSVVSNMSTLIKPYIEKLKSTPLDAIQTNHLNVIETNLEQIISPFVRDIGSRVLDLTPMEIRVANLVKEGKSNIEIAEKLSVSKNTILTHRFNLRRKLGIKNKKINLRAYLLSFH
ncbi:PAS domain S-box protein [delta proteobacterium NaphS2]|nr:PAS domain S-box protein [delta proteobacterium NaphS2]